MGWICPCGAINGDERQSCKTCGFTLSARHQMSEDRREQLRAIRLLGAIALVVLTGGIGLYILIHGVARSQPEQTAVVSRSEPAPEPTRADANATAITSPPQPSRLTELRGSIAQRREYDLRLIRTVSRIINSQSREAKFLSYCMFTAHEAEQLGDSTPETEYQLQADGTVLVTSGQSAKTPEQIFRDGERRQLELETGGGPMVQDCAGSLAWFGTWHNKPMPTDEKFTEIGTKAKADKDEVDQTLDSRLVEMLPKP